MQRIFEMKSVGQFAVRCADLVLLPLTLFSALLLKFWRARGTDNTPASRLVFRTVGLLPVRDHYYEPLFHPQHIRHPLDTIRDLAGIDLNIPAQLQLLERFNFQSELLLLEQKHLEDGVPHFEYRNSFYGSGDAELLYSMVRWLRPGRLVEIGSGYSTLAAEAAIRENQQNDPAINCEHICIEPYERPWLRNLNVRVIRERAELINLDLFETLGENDILFIDSSHIIRPQGDVLFIYQSILPRLRPGVFVHIHDIFTPRDYPAAWVVDAAILWNEQYLLEAFLAFNPQFEVVCSLNHLCREHPKVVADKFPRYALEATARQPGAFWIRRSSR